MPANLSVRALLFIASLSALEASAIDESEIKVADRWSIVGVIAEADLSGAGVAVLRQNTTKRTYTLAVGDSLPSEYGFVLTSVKGRSVTVRKGTHLVTLSFAEQPLEETTDSDLHRTAKFLESYYRGLSDNASDSADSDPEPQPTAFGKFSQLRDEPRPGRYELYRDARTLRMLDEPSATGDEHSSDIGGAQDSRSDDRSESTGEADDGDLPPLSDAVP